MNRPAISSVGVIFLAGLASWLALSSLVRRDSYFTRLGRTWEIEFAWVRAEQFDREAECGDRPAAWLVGSSITRDAFDAALLESALRGSGVDVCVRKFAFGSGAPLFSRAMALQLDVRPGDLVLTSVAVDNFRKRWLDHFKSADRYVQFTLSPEEIWAIDELNTAQKVEYTLAWAPPRAFFRYQGSYQSGALRWAKSWLLRLEAPEMRERFEDDPYDRRHRDPKFRRTPRTFRLTPPLFDLSTTQTNIAALLAWQAETEARGATPWALFVPSHPEYEAKFLAPELTGQMHDWMTANMRHYARLAPLPDEAFIDYKHPNDVGRPVLTRELADLLARDWHPAEPR